MSRFKIRVALGIAVAAWIVIAGTPHEASGRNSLMGFQEPLELRAFRTGPLTTNTQRFLPVGRRDGTEVNRYDLLLFAFSVELDPDTVDAQTIRVGTIGEGGTFVPARGSLSQFVEREFDPVFGGYVGSRLRRNRWFFDPTDRMGFEPNYEGFDPGTTYTVIVPGFDMGAHRTIRTRDGRRLARTFRTTFKTTSEPFDWTSPTVESIEASDAPGIPLDGRTDVERDAGIVVRFSEPMLPGSFYNDRSFNGSTYHVREFERRGLRDRPVPIEASSDLRTYTFRPRGGRFRAAKTIQFILSRDLADRNGNSMGGANLDGAYLSFVTAAGP